MSLLAARGVVVAYGGVRAVDGVSLDLEPGESLGLIGPNGAGKSSFLGALGGQIRLAEGSIALEGHEVGRLPAFKRARRGITRTFQMTSEFARMTVFENLVTAGHGAEGAALARVVLRRRETRRAERDVADRAWAVLDRFEMTHAADFYGAELSGGQRRLVEIMRCLMREPKVLLLDEPMVGVAPHLVAKLTSDLRSIQDDGIALVIVEHALEVVQDLCGRVIVMALGRPIATGTFDEVVADPEVQAAYVG
ncbi:MAG TPA: ATP-binding cassette domain-containing protein [Gaiellaceae bacterium]|nr:ATP-binding cassette domain-containing protein [Gaiellaceae bacterium]